jgi:cysteine desulfurase
MNSVKPRGKSKIVTTAIEHPSVSNAVNQLAMGNGYEVVRVFPGNNIAAHVDDNTALVSMTSACSETGFTLDTEGIYAEIKAHFPDCIVHVDAAQAFLKIKDIDGDLISISAHKVGGLPGIGALYIKAKARVAPMFFGGGQQNGIRSGTEPTALIAAFGVCGWFSMERGVSEHLTSKLKQLDLIIHSRDNIPNIVNFSCGVKSEVMLHFLAEHGIYVSSGSACARGKKSQILVAYGIKDKDIDTAIRVSFGWQNTIEEVDKFLSVLETGINRLRR